MDIKNKIEYIMMAVGFASVVMELYLLDFGFQGFSGFL